MRPSSVRAKPRLVLTKSTRLEIRAASAGRLTFFQLLPAVGRHVQCLEAEGEHRAARAVVIDQGRLADRLPRTRLNESPPSVERRTPLGPISRTRFASSASSARRLRSRAGVEDLPARAAVVGAQDRPAAVERVAGALARERGVHDVRRSGHAEAGPARAAVRGACQRASVPDGERKRSASSLAGGRSRPSNCCQSPTRSPPRHPRRLSCRSPRPPRRASRRQMPRHKI